MSRYLTPPKIGLLVLITLYCESVVPSASTIPILSFIVSKIVPGSDAADIGASSSTSPFECSIEDFERVTFACASNVPGRTLLDLFLRKLWGISSLHSLHEFFDSLNELLAKTKADLQRDAENGEETTSDQIRLTRTSPLGMFVRRARLEFTRLQFHDAIKLWIALVKYREPSLATWKKRNPSATNTSFDSNIGDLGLQLGDGLLEVAYRNLSNDIEAEDIISTDDIERVLEIQIEKLQKFGDRIPDDMKRQFQNMTGPSATVPSLAHFVKFFDAWRAGDYTSAFDNLHRYFDYTMQTRDKTYYQYALLHMAILQADFGCFSEAISAMKETIATARENQDISCLNFSLSWLNHLGKAYPKQMREAGHEETTGSERDALHFLKSKAKESKTWSLLSSTLLSEAKLGLANGESLPRVLELVYQSSHLNVLHNIKSNVGSQMLLQASVFGRLGSSHLSDVQNDMLLECHGETSPVEEMVRAACRGAFARAQAGQYDEAFQALQAIKPEVHRTLKFHQYLISYSGLLKLKRSLRRSDLVAAEHVLDQLKAGSVSDPEITFQICLLEIDFLCRQGSSTAAFAKIEDLASELKNGAADVFQRIVLLNIKATLFADCGQAHRGLSLAMRAAHTAQRARVFPTLWAAVGTISNILNILEEYEAAKRLLDAVIPQALEGGDCFLCAQLYSFQADAHMGLAGNEAEDSRQRGSKVGMAEVYLDHAREYYKRVEDINGECEMLAKKAIIARLRGDEKLADDWAANYVSTYEQAMRRNREEQGA